MSFLVNDVTKENLLFFMENIDNADVQSSLLGLQFKGTKDFLLNNVHIKQKADHQNGYFSYIGGPKRHSTKHTVELSFESTLIESYHPPNNSLIIEATNNEWSYSLSLEYGRIIEVLNQKFVNEGPSHITNVFSRVGNRKYDKSEKLNSRLLTYVFSGQELRSTFNKFYMLGDRFIGESNLEEIEFLLKDGRFPPTPDNPFDDELAAYVTLRCR